MVFEAKGSDWIPSGTQEVLALSHRILTMYRGRLTGEFTRHEANQEILLAAAAGERV